MTVQSCEGERPFGRIIATTVSNSTKSALQAREIAEKSRIILLIHDSENADQTYRSSQVLQRLDLNERDIVLMDLPPKWLKDHSSPVLQAFYESRLFDFSDPTITEWDEEGFLEQKKLILLESVCLCSEIQNSEREVSSYRESQIRTCFTQALQNITQQEEVNALLLDLKAENSERKSAAKNKLSEVILLSQEKSLARLFDERISQHEAAARRLIVFCKMQPSDQENYQFLSNHRPYTVFDITKDEYFDPQPRTSPRNEVELI
ncbi:MAG: hypothetical protein LLG04_09665 [Parachlamydia sp.]|nr:hypothetical protein [Parachlamydia sp.]